MIQAAIAAVILMGIYKLVDWKKPETNEPEIDWWMSFAFIFAPGFLIFLISIGISASGLPAALLLVAYILYFIIPFLVLKTMLDYSAKKSFKYAVWVPVVAILTEIPFVLLMAGANA